MAAPPRAKILFFERFSYIFGNRLDLPRLQIHRNHLVLTLDNGVENLFIDVSLPELGVGEIAGTRAEVSAYGALAVPFLAMASHALDFVNLFAVFSPGAMGGPK